MIGEEGWPCQLGIVVPDIEAAMEQWVRTFGAGPFVYVPEILGTQFLYREQPVDLDLAVALAYLGDTQIELIEQRNDAPSPYRDFLSAGRAGLQHLGFWHSDPVGAGQRIISEGYKRAFVGRLPGAQTGSIYYEPPAGDGPMIEISAATPAKFRAYQRLRTLAKGFDGNRPVRSYASFGDFLAETD